ARARGLRLDLGRAERIRTSGLRNPIATRYQAALPPETSGVYRLVQTCSERSGSKRRTTSSSVEITESGPGEKRRRWIRTTVTPASASAGIWSIERSREPSTEGSASQTS